MPKRIVRLLAALPLLAGCYLPPWTSLDSSDQSVHRAAFDDHYKQRSAEDRFHSW